MAALRIDSSSSVGTIFCCNAPKCNRQNQPVTTAINCYVCDSRVTGQEGCRILNTSSEYVYKAGSSMSSESCAVSILGNLSESLI